MVKEANNEDNEASNVLPKTFIRPRLAEHTRHLELTLEHELGLLSLKQDTTNQYHEGLKQTHKETNRLLVALFTEIRQDQIGCHWKETCTE